MRLGLRRLKRRLRTMLALAAMFAGLVLFARLVRLALALMIALLSRGCVARELRMAAAAAGRSRAPGRNSNSSRSRRGCPPSASRSRYAAAAGSDETPPVSGDQAEVMLGMLMEFSAATGTPEERASAQAGAFLRDVGCDLPQISMSEPLDSDIRVIGF